MNVRVRVLTFNIGDQKRLRNEWVEQIENHWPPLSDARFDVLLLALQEDFGNKTKYGAFGAAVEQVLGREFVRVAAVEKNPTLKKLQFSVKANIYVRKSLFPLLRSTRVASVCLGIDRLARLACAKSCVGVRLNFSSPDQQSSSSSLVFAACHLPIDVNRADDLGLEARKTALKRAMKYVIGPLSRNKNGIPDHPSVILTGDLNFRREQRFHNRDQLQFLLQSWPPLRPWREANEIKFAPTCKMNVCHDDQVCSICRHNTYLTPQGTPADASCYTRQTKKGVRTPSHCDRVLYIGKDLHNVSYQSFVDSPSVMASDHNAVVADFVWKMSGSRSDSQRRSEQLNLAACLRRND